MKLADDARRGAREGRGHPRPGHQGPHRAPACWSPRPATSPRSTTSRSCSTGPTAPSWRWPRPRAAWRSSSWPSSGPTRWPGSRSTRSPGSTRPRPTEIVAAGKIPAAVADQAADVIVKLWETFVAEDATLVEVNPLVRDPRGQGHRARRQGHPRRERRLPAPRPRRAGRRAHREPARGEGQGQGPQLRQARRRPGRHHRQRRGPGDVHPGRRRLRRREARRGQARQLPRHRRRRVGAR